MQMREVVTEESLPRAVIPGRPLAGSKGLDHALFIDVASSTVRGAAKRQRKGSNGEKPRLSSPIALAL